MFIKSIAKYYDILIKRKAAPMAYYLKFRVFFIILFLVALSIVVYQGIVPGGKISYCHKFDKSNYFIKKFIPEARVDQIENGQQAIIGDPVYFSLRTPRKFNKASLSFKYKNISESPVIEAGIMTDKKMWQYNLKPVENRIIDQLSLVWDATREDNLLLLQRKISTSSKEIKKYKNIEELKNNIPDIDEIAVYNYNLGSEYIINDYAPDDGSTVIDYPLRGSYQFYTYIKDEDMDISFDFYDLNQNVNSDDMEIFVYYQKELIDSRIIKDEGAATDNRVITERKPLQLKYSNLPEGVYMVAVRTNDDVVTKKISTAQSKISFINKLWIYNGKDSSMELFTDSRMIDALATDPAKLQTIKIDDKELFINETYKQFNLKAGSGIKKISLEKGGLTIAGDGVFSFNKDSIVSADIKKADSNLGLNDENVNYIIADYTPAIEVNGWKEAKIEFDLNNAYRENESSLFSLGWSGRYNFIISIPGLKADDDINDYILIDEIKIDLEGATVFDKFKKLFKKNE